jgi:hypothetical protein
MKTLVICRPRAGVERQQIAAYAGEEMAELRRLREEGVLLEAYSPGGPGAILLFDAEAERLTEALAGLPLAREGLIDAETIELYPFPGFG